ncbi:hypothetical protein BLOT_000495 [Blomia tropicalis]|nr:hypothetical protein BLOT_000495 [Blomia tropicalis]
MHSSEDNNESHHEYHPKQDDSQHLSGISNINDNNTIESSSTSQCIVNVNIEPLENNINTGVDQLLHQKYKNCSLSSVPSNISNIAEKCEQKRPSLTYVLLPEKVDNTNRSNNGTKNRPRNGFHEKAYDYTHRVLRYVKPLDVLVVLVLLLAITLSFYVIGFDLRTKRSIVYILLVWILLAAYYLCIPTFRRWFYYWDPDFSLHRPS